MYEWRVFFPFNPTKLSQEYDLFRFLNKSPMPDRIANDIYVNVGHNDFGLKLRNFDGSQGALELKICKKRNTGGIEKWSKVTGKKSKIDEISKNLKELNVNRLEECLNAWKQKNLADLVTIKKVREIGQIGGCRFEQTDITIPLNTGQLLKYRSICIEGKEVKGDSD